MRTKRSIAVALLGLLLFSWSPVLAQQAPGAPNPDPIGQNLYPPDLVFLHAEAIGLSDSQKTAIQSAVLSAQSHFVVFQPRLEHATQTMVRLLSQSHVNDAEVLAQLDKILSVEREVKRTQIGLMIRIKDVLTAEQQAKLRQLRGERGPH